MEVLGGNCKRQILDLSRSVSTVHFQGMENKEECEGGCVAVASDGDWMCSATGANGGYVTYNGDEDLLPVRKARDLRERLKA